MSNFISNLFGPKKNKNNNQKFDDQSKKKENNQNKNEEEIEDLPPVVIPRRFSLSKSGRMKEKKRTKLGIHNVSKIETVDCTTHKSEPNSESASKESLEKAE